MAETEIRLELVWKCQSLLTWNFMSRRVRQKRISDLNQSWNVRASSRQTSCHGGLDSNRNQTWISLDMSELPQLNRNQTWISLEMSEPPNKKTSMSWRVRLLPKSDLNQFVHVRASSPKQKSNLNESGNESKIKKHKRIKEFDWVSKFRFQWDSKIKQRYFHLRTLIEENSNVNKICRKCLPP